jgi:hypothetical protein
MRTQRAAAVATAASRGNDHTVLPVFMLLLSLSLKENLFQLLPPGKTVTAGCCCCCCQAAHIIPATVPDTRRLFLSCHLISAGAALPFLT